MHSPPASHAGAHMRALQYGAVGPHGSHPSPVALPAHGSYGPQAAGAGSHPPTAVQVPSNEGAAHGGLANRHGGSAMQRSPQTFPSHGSVMQEKVPTVAQAPPGSHAVAAKVGHGSVSPHGLQASPQRFPAQGAGAGHEIRAPQRLPPSQKPSLDVAASTHGVPHGLPSQPVDPGHVNVPGATQPPDGSQAFATAVSTQRESPGAQTVQASPHAFPPQGSYP